MYNIKWKNAEGRVCEEVYETLDLALTRSKEIGQFVTIKSNDYELVGIFGADSVDNGKLPNGDNYTWYKRRYVKK